MATKQVKVICCDECNPKCELHPDDYRFNWTVGTIYEAEADGWGYMSELSDKIYCPECFAFWSDDGNVKDYYAEIRYQEEKERDL